MFDAFTHSFSFESPSGIVHQPRPPWIRGALQWEDVGVGKGRMSNVEQQAMNANDPCKGSCRHTRCIEMKFSYIGRIVDF